MYNEEYSILVTLTWSIDTSYGDWVANIGLSDHNGVKVSHVAQKYEGFVVLCVFAESEDRAQAFSDNLPYMKLAPDDLIIRSTNLLAGH